MFFYRNNVVSGQLFDAKTRKSDAEAAGYVGCWCCTLINTTVEVAGCSVRYCTYCNSTAEGAFEKGFDSVYARPFFTGTLNVRKIVRMHFAGFGYFT